MLSTFYIKINVLFFKKNLENAPIYRSNVTLYMQQRPLNRNVKHDSSMTRLSPVSCSGNLMKLSIGKFRSAKHSCNVLRQSNTGKNPCTAFFS